MIHVEAMHLRAEINTNTDIYRALKLSQKIDNYYMFSPIILLVICKLENIIYQVLHDHQQVMLSTSTSVTLSLQALQNNVCYQHKHSYFTGERGRKSSLTARITKSALHANKERPNYRPDPSASFA